MRKATEEAFKCLVVAEKDALVKFKGGCFKDFKNKKGKVVREGMNYFVQVKAEREVMNYHILDLEFLH